MSAIEKLPAGILRSRNLNKLWLEIDAVNFEISRQKLGVFTRTASDIQNRLRAGSFPRDELANLQCFAGVVLEGINGVVDLSRDRGHSISCQALEPGLIEDDKR